MCVCACLCGCVFVCVCDCMHRGTNTVACVVRHQIPILPNRELTKCLLQPFKKNFNLIFYCPLLLEVCITQL